MQQTLNEIELAGERAMNADLHREHDRMAAATEEAERVAAIEAQQDLESLEAWHKHVSQLVADIYLAVNAGERERAWRAVEELECEVVKKMEECPL